MAQASAAKAGSGGTSLRVRVQKFGTFLSGMVMPNLGAFIAWGLITALFIPDGWLPNERLAELVGPMITYLLPLLIGYTGGRLIHDTRGGVVGVLAAILAATVVSFLVASVIIRATRAGDEGDDEDQLMKATSQMETMKGKKSSVAGTLTGTGAAAGTANGATNGGTSGNGAATVEPRTSENGDAFDYSRVNKIIFACDAGMGSSAMGASLLKNKAKKAGLTDIEIKNAAVSQIPDDADVIITHKDLTDRARQKLPGAQHVSVDNFLGSPKYDELIDEISSTRV